MTDLQIIELLRKRDERGLREVERQYGARLKKIASGLVLEEDADECMNDLLLALWNHIPPDHPDNLFSYCAIILRNIAIDRWRKEKAKARYIEIVELTDEIAACIPDPGSNTEEEAVLAVSNVVNEFLNRLECTKKEVFVLFFWYGKSAEEIASLYGFSVGKVRMMIHRLAKSLKSEIRGTTI